MQKQALTARIYLGCVIALFLTGCSYHRPTAVLSPPHEGHEQTQSKVSVRIKPLRDFECSHYFDNRLVMRGIQPIQLYIQNDTDNYYVLDGQNISLPLMGKRDVGAVLYKNMVGRSLTWLFCSVAFLYQVFLPILVVDLLFCAQANKNIHNDISNICINPKEKLVIDPRTRVHKVLFVPSDDYHHHLTLVLNEQNRDGQLVFKF